MRVTHYGVRGSTGREPAPQEICDRILRKTKGKTIDKKTLQELVPTGGLGYGGNTLCVLLEEQEDKLIIDAGSGIRALSPLYLENPSLPIHIALTHMHWDHIQGIPFFVPFYIPGREINIYSSFDEKTILDALRYQSHPPYFPVRFEELQCDLKVHRLERDTVNHIGPFDLSVIYLKHPQPCSGFRVNAGAASYAHISDTELLAYDDAEKQDMRKFLKGVQVVVADTQFTFEDAKKFATWGHSCLDSFVDFLHDIEVEILQAYHYSPNYSDENIDEMLEAAIQMKNEKYPASTLKIQPSIEGQSILL